ncbi:transposase [Amaricoccus sp.]|uniref:transposase n=1 Tax=Amaricoccus sp. TaxID=1872485 RepID=UPI001B6639E2|nr:transposase [Amaricoccus sp.]MBP7003335.1 transposase [Amaricoccus sp.]
MRYSDAAILCALGLGAAFGLTLRQTQGFLHDLTRLLGLEIAVPHYSTFSRRAATLAVPALTRSPRSDGGGRLHLAVDATGLKVCGEGEWKVRVHGPDKDDRIIRAMDDFRAHAGGAAPARLREEYNDVMRRRGRPVESRKCRPRPSRACRAWRQ